MLYFIGLGMSLKNLTLEAIEKLKNANKVYVDTYTSIVPDFSIRKLQEMIGMNKIILAAKRRDLEGHGINKIIEEAKHFNVAILTPGDPFIATTHDAIRIEALKRGIKVDVVNGLTIYSLAPSRTGLQAYRFGKTVTLVYPEYFKPLSTLETIYENLERNLHTLLLLDIDVEKNKAMTIREAVDILMDLDEKKKLHRIISVGLARAGTDEEVIRADKLEDLPKYSFPPPPHSIIIVAKPHPVELDSLRYVCGLPQYLYEHYSSGKAYP